MKLIKKQSDGGIKINSMFIHPQNVDAGEKLYKQLLAREWWLLLLAQLQQGKTNTLIYVGAKLLEDAMKDIESGLISKAEIIVFLNINSNEITGQTKERFFSCSDDVGRLFGAFLDNAVKSFNMSQGRECLFIQFAHIGNAHKLKYRAVDRRLWLVDEAHAANNSGGVYQRKLAEYGIDRLTSPANWDERDGTINFLLETSATPHTHLNGLIKGNAPVGFGVVIMEFALNYLSLERAHANGRFRNLTDYLMIEVSEGVYKPSEQFECILKEFESSCNADGFGHLVIRMNPAGRNGKGKGRYNALIAFLKTQKFKTLVFGCGGKNKESELPIKQFDMEVVKSPPLPTILVIKSSKRAGMTLPKEHNIRGMIETTAFGRKDAVAELVQGLVGRSMGHDKGSDTYPIYCDLEKVEEEIESYRQLWASINHKKGLKSVTHIPATKYVLPSDTGGDHVSWEEISPKDITKIGKKKFYKGEAVVVRIDTRNPKENFEDIIRRGKSHLTYRGTRTVLIYKGKFYLANKERGDGSIKISEACSLASSLFN